MDDRTKRIVRAIFGLKSPPPAGSQHYRSGWDDGLEAAIDAAKNAAPAITDRAAVERVRAVLETEAVIGRSALEYRGLIASALMADEATEPTPVLNSAERAMLRYALDQAQERIWSEDGFTDEDQAAVDSLKRLVGEDAQS